MSQITPDNLKRRINDAKKLMKQLFIVDPNWLKNKLRNIDKLPIEGVEKIIDILTNAKRQQNLWCQALTYHDHLFSSNIEMIVYREKIKNNK